MTTPAAAPLVEDFPGRADLSISVPVRADQPTAFAAITQWSEQGRWMLGTRVWVSRGTGRSVGDELAGFTGVGRLGFLDTMVITEMDEQLVVVRHTGRVVRGIGWMGAQDRDGSVRFVWGEAVALPLGPVGRLGWRVVGPLMRHAVRYSLRSLARQVEAGDLPASARPR